MEVIKIGYRLLQLVSLIIFLNQAWVTMVKFWERPVIQEVSVERHEDLKYDIYLCHLDGFDADKGKWSDDQQAITSSDILSEFIDYACETYALDKNNVSLLGFSQGTILSYSLALTYPEKVKNIIALSGYVNEAIIPESLNPDNYKHLDFYCSHGSVDQVIPVDWARRSKPFLDKLEIKNTYSEFPVGHGVAPQNFYEFKNWLVKRI